jgi:FxLD family lantipeptide
MNNMAPHAAVADPEFDLDVSIVESVPVDGELLRNTDDNCTSTSDSACVTCFHG